MATLSRGSGEPERTIGGVEPDVRARDVRQRPALPGAAPDRTRSTARDRKPATSPIASRGREEWETIPSLPGSQMRANGALGMAEVRHEGQIVAVTGLAAIQDWSSGHGLTPTDAERLVTLDIAARRYSMEPAQAQSGPDASQPGLVDRNETVKVLAQARQELSTKHRPEIQRPERERDATMNSAKTPAQAGDAQRIGRNMSKPDWEETVKLLSMRAPGEETRTLRPKAGSQYGGEILLVTDTHLVQGTASRNTAVVHDLDKLSNGRQLAADFDAGKVQVGQMLRVEYGPAQEGGKATVMPFDAARAAQFRQETSAWAAEALKVDRVRETFLKLADNRTREIAARQPEARDPSRSGPAPTRGPAKER